MGISYLFLDPPRRQNDGASGDDAPGDGLPPTFLSNAHALGPIRYAFAKDPNPIFTDPSLPPDQRAATRAAEQFRRGFASAWNKYGSLSLQDAVDGYADFAQTLDAHRAKALASVSGPAQQILKPALDQMHFEGSEIGLAHWDRHNQEVNRQIQAAQAKRAEADQADAQTLVADVHEAHDAHDDPVRLQSVAQRSGETWLQIARRNGWSQPQLDRQIAQWNGQLYGVAVARHLDAGDVAGAMTVLANAKERLDPDTFGRLSDTVDAGARYIRTRQNATADGEDTVVEGPGDFAVYGGAGKDRINDDTGDAILIAANSDADKGGNSASPPDASPSASRFNAADAAL